MEDAKFNLSRRTAFGALGALGGAAGFASMFARTASAAEMTAEEKANVKMIKDYMEVWRGPNLTLDGLVADIAEDCFVTINPGPPEVLTSRAAVSDAFKSFLAYEGFELEILEAHASGPAVFVDRMDYSLKDGKRSDEGTPAVGLFIVAEGKIKYWHDYAFPST
jgi:limonene-1,2-epoxide hydrolase